MAKKNQKCADNTHPACVSSDSNLAVCVCWCAECKEYMTAIAKEWEKN
jgi:hypothetical protein